MGFFSSKKCEVCGSKETEKFNTFKLTRSGTVPCELNKRPNFGDAEGKFDLAFSDVNKNNPSGTCYWYKTSDTNSFHELCSLKCAYDFSVKNNSIVLFVERLRKEVLIAIEDGNGGLHIKSDVW